MQFCYYKKSQFRFYKSIFQLLPLNVNILLLDSDNNIKSQTMNKLSGARNTAGLSRSLTGGRLPSHTHLTYQGLFNELKYKAGPKTDKTLDLSFGYSRFQFLDSNFDTSINDYLYIFLKGKKDGEDRSQNVNLNLSICLDVSGSMGAGLGSSQKIEGSRLSLSIEAIRMLISKLKPKDSVSLVTFENNAQTIFKQIYKSDLNQDIFSLLGSISAGGSTTIINGFQRSRQILETWLSEHTNQGLSQNRIVMITDVDDSSLSSSKHIISECAQIRGINTSIIGISSQFKSQVCQKFKDIKGFNYFCAVQQSDIKKYVFETFDFGFFASAYNINIDIQSQDLQNIEVFGTPDSHNVEFYNQNIGSQKCWAITKMKSCFPSEIEIHGGQTYIVGGLILVKLRRKSKSPCFKGKIYLTYDDPQKNKYTQNYEVSYQFHPQQQFLSGQEFRQVIEGFTFVSELKTILKEAQTIKQNHQIYNKYWEGLNKLEQLCPKAKLKDYQNIKNILKGFHKKQSLETAI